MIPETVFHVYIVKNVVMWFNAFPWHDVFFFISFHYVTTAVGETFW